MKISRKRVFNDSKLKTMNVKNFILCLNHISQLNIKESKFFVNYQ